jgi:3-oxoacyl-[acyl-carrier-protein] synthase II
MTRRRAVITGLGAISPVGSTIDDFWNNLLAGRSGIRRITQFDPSDLPCQIAGEIPDFNPTDYIEKKEECCRRRRLA